MDVTTPTAKALIRCAALIAVVTLMAIVAFVAGLGTLAPYLFLGLGMGFMKQDNDPAVFKSTTLPAGANTVESDGIDLQNTSRGDFLANVEVLIEVPALATGEVPDDDVITFDVYHDTESDFSSEELLLDNVLTLTGAGGSGTDASEVRVRLPVDVHRYIRVKATSGDAAVDADAKEFTTRLVF